MFEYKEKRYTKMAEKGGAEGKKKKKRKKEDQKRKKGSVHTVDQLHKFQRSEFEVSL